MLTTPNVGCFLVGQPVLSTMGYATYHMDIEVDYVLYDPQGGSCAGVLGITYLEKGGLHDIPSFKFFSLVMTLDTIIACGSLASFPGITTG